MGIPLLLLGCVIIPLLPCLLLLRHRRQLDTADVKRRWGFLYCNYRSEVTCTAAAAAALAFGQSASLSILHLNVMPKGMPTCVGFAIPQLPLSSSSMTISFNTLCICSWWHAAIQSKPVLRVSSGNLKSVATECIQMISVTGGSGVGAFLPSSSGSQCLCGLPERHHEHGTLPDVQG